MEPNAKAWDELEQCMFDAYIDEDNNCTIFVTDGLPPFGPCPIDFAHIAGFTIYPG